MLSGWGRPGTPEGGLHLRVSGRAAGRGQLTAGGIPDPAPWFAGRCRARADRAVPAQLARHLGHQRGGGGAGASCGRRTSCLCRRSGSENHLRVSDGLAGFYEPGITRFRAVRCLISSRGFDSDTLRTLLRRFTGVTL
jgi:hypothetical protein